LGGPARAVYANERLAAEPRQDWRKGVDRGLAAALQVHGPVIVATTTGRSVIALNAETGTQYWSRRFGGPIAGTALRRDEIVFVATGDRDNRVHALNIRRGRTVWSRRVGIVRVEPLLLDSTLVVATEPGEAIALQASSGDPVWRIPLGASPALAPVPAGGSLYIVTSRDTLLRIDPANGNVTARLHLPATPSAPALATPTHLILPLHSAEVIAVNVTGEPHIDWRTSVDAVVLAPVVYAGGEFFALNQNADIHRINANGEASRIARLGGAASGSFARIGQYLLAGCLDGSLYLLDGNGNIAWEHNLGDSVIAPVAASNGVLYVPLLRGDIVRMR
jgi:outer membrane protein assembly factor BamB